MGLSGGEGGKILHRQLINICTEDLKCVFTQGLLNDLLRGECIQRLVVFSSNQSVSQAISFKACSVYKVR
jgi:hypothetical protein